MRALFLALVATTVLQPMTAAAEPQRKARPVVTVQPAPPAYMRVFATTLPPFGFVELCERLPGECMSVGRSQQRFDATPERMTELDAVNRHVNRIIQPVTDQDLYGVAERWTIPHDRGDCEDYALLKRQILISKGWPSSALLMTVVRDERGDGHAILTARTRQGDYILDNKVTDIKSWHKTSYRFVMRQSYADPRVWMSLDPWMRQRPRCCPAASGRADRSPSACRCNPAT